jgi:hypothetical protein
MICLATNRVNGRHRAERLVSRGDVRTRAARRTRVAPVEAHDTKLKRSAFIPLGSAADQERSMVFDHAPFADLPSFRGEARGEAAPVYPDWLLPLAQSTLAALADKALAEEIADRRCDATPQAKASHRVLRRARPR